jgi:hypothetical protein
LEEELAGSGMDIEARKMVQQIVSLEPVDWEAHLEQLPSRAEPVTEPSQWRVGRFNNPLQRLEGLELADS